MTQPTRGIQASVVTALNAEINQILSTAQIRQFMAQEGAEPTPGPPEALAQHLSAEPQRWNEIVKSAGIRLE